MSKLTCPTGAHVEAACLSAIRRAVGGEICSIGVDVVDIDDFAVQTIVGGTAFLESVFTPGELGYAAGRIDRLATRFAAKEAAAKALGTGIRGFHLIDVEVETGATGEVSLRLRGRATRVAEEQGIDSLFLTMSRDAGLALAAVVARHKPRLEDKR